MQEELINSLLVELAKGNREFVESELRKTGMSEEQLETALNQLSSVLQTIRLKAERKARRNKIIEFAGFQVLLLAAAIGFIWFFVWLIQEPGCIWSFSFARLCVIDSILLTGSISAGLTAAATFLFSFKAYFE